MTTYSLTSQITLKLAWIIWRWMIAKCVWDEKTMYVAIISLEAIHLLLYLLYIIMHYYVLPNCNSYVYFCTNLVVSVFSDLRVQLDFFPISIYLYISICHVLESNELIVYYGAVTRKQERVHSSCSSVQELFIDTIIGVIWKRWCRIIIENWCIENKHCVSRTFYVNYTDLTESTYKPPTVK